MIVIPMAGLSERFSKAGYSKAKYMLDLHGRSLFEWSLHSFSNHFADTPFLFVFRDIDETRAFLEQKCRDLGILDSHFAELTSPTSGQAETVLNGLNRIEYPDNGTITIFNIDTIRKPTNVLNLADTQHVDGLIEVFKGTGENWSFVKAQTSNSTRVVETSEKRPISNLCCTGLYHFRSAGDFRNAYKNPTAPKGDAETRERYVAPLYNRLIEKGRNIRYVLIPAEDVVFCGVPEEYEMLKKTRTSLDALL